MGKRRQSKTARYSQDDFSCLLCRKSLFGLCACSILLKGAGMLWPPSTLPAPLKPSRWPLCVFQPCLSIASGGAFACLNAALSFLLKLLMEIYNLRSSLTTPFCRGLLPGSIKSKPDGLKMCFLLSLIVICLFIIRKDKFWLREILLAVNNVIKKKSEVPALHGADLR